MSSSAGIQPRPGILADDRRNFESIEVVNAIGPLSDGRNAKRDAGWRFPLSSSNKRGKS